MAELRGIECCDRCGRFFVRVSFQCRCLACIQRVKQSRPSRVRTPGASGDQYHGKHEYDK
jgi:hypothetical protein